jgi:hypothetical protein
MTRIPLSSCIRFGVSALTVLALAAGLAACDDSESGGAAATVDVTTTGPDFGAPQGQDEKELAIRVANLYGYLAAGDMATVCTRLTASARKQVTGSGSSCEKALNRLVAPLRESNSLESVSDVEVGDVEIDDGNARITVAFGSQGAQLRLREVAGEWKLVSLPALPSQ